MRESMPNTHGYVDRGPRLNTTLDVENATLPSVWPGDKDDLAIERQGRMNPRRLSLEEERLVKRNREIAQEDLQAMEAWYKSSVKTVVKKKR